jgi:hypothetical protein
MYLLCFLDLCNNFHFWEEAILKNFQDKGTLFLRSFGLLTQLHSVIIPDDLNRHEHRCANLKSSF